MACWHRVHAARLVQRKMKGRAYAQLLDTKRKAGSTNPTVSPAELRSIRKAADTVSLVTTQCQVESSPDGLM